MPGSSFDSMDHLSLIRQHEQSNEGFFQDSFAIQSSSSIVTEPFMFSMDCLLYDPSMPTQHYPAPGPSFTTSSSIHPANLNYLSQTLTRHLSPQRNNVTESLDVNHLSPSQSTVCMPSTASIQKAPAPNGNHIDIIQKDLISGRSQVTKQGDCNTFQCHWTDCKYRGMFSRKNVLMRHIKTQHVTPRSFDCPRCARSFGRKDNMREHMGRVHWEH
ncbi:hypothetical protein N7463_010292 [Penicillium fimorum]|uniref:C2H2-type domain-containing protein n=1 Tax=Penicillium fimorum TaxID=1882269 RepID=A0A9W9XKC9_9EURO|nr:hypothetical protein N7463_010292 [Penicillium fimorum]